MNKLIKKLPAYRFNYIHKFKRFIRIYGIKRTLIKSLGRSRFNLPKLNFGSSNKSVSIVGCGQFAFASIGYFLKKNKGNVFISCFDIDKTKMQQFGKFYATKIKVNSYEEVLSNRELKQLYIASNHNTHTSYAIKSLESNINTYIEKPLSTNYEQFTSLLSSKSKSSSEVYVGYNRPFSAAIQKIRSRVFEIEEKEKLSFSVNYFIHGHKIEKDHWYRKPEEGTRVCGNMGHWLDLTIHLLLWRSLPKILKINITYSKYDEPDDNVSLTLTSDHNDLFIITLTSRTEPFEGINESIDFQFGDIIAKIDDFRSLRIWQNEKYYKKRYWPKDVGHEKAILQPFSKEKRNWEEVELSTLLMLKIKDMVLERMSVYEFNIEKELHKLKLDIEELEKEQTNNLS